MRWHATQFVIAGDIKGDAVLGSQMQGVDAVHSQAGGVGAAAGGAVRNVNLEQVCAGGMAQHLGFGGVQTAVAAHIPQGVGADVLADQFEVFKGKDGAVMFVREQSFHQSFLLGIP